MSPKVSTTQYYARERRKGRNISAVLHVSFLILSITGLPSFLFPPPPEEPTVISVEILPITGITNVKPSDSAPAEEVKPEEKKPDQKKPAPPVKTEEPQPTSEPAPTETPKQIAEAIKKAIKEEKKKEEKKKAKPKENDLAAILKAVKETAQKEKKDKKPQDKKEDTSLSKSTSQQYNSSMPMSMSEKDAIMSQIEKCWTVPAGAKDAQNLTFTLNAEYNQDGSLVKVGLASENGFRYNSDSFFRTAVESAIRAVRQCSPLKGLPPEKFGTWQLIDLRFDPKNMLN